MMKWGDNATLKFLELYRSLQCLWDIHNENYRNKSERDKALNTLVEGMGIANFTPEECRNKIKNIRTTYKRELTLVFKAERANEVYVPKLIWFEAADEFLRDVSKKIIIKHKYEDYKEYEEEGEHLNEYNLCESKFLGGTISDDNELRSNKKAKSHHEEGIPKPQEFEQIEIISEPVVKKAFKKDSSKKVDCPAYTKDRLTGNTKFQNAETSTKPFNIEDEFDIFGKHLAFQLKTMPLKRALMCQEKLQTVITQERLMILDEEEKRKESNT